ncbi:MAG: EF-Tu/IF-2/RF-3 family GTPase [Planctomycetaceae bacterium]|nr:hypothetical protein [Planctomycetaceae bacterium]
MKLGIGIGLALILAAFVIWMVLRRKEVTQTRANTHFSMPIDDVFALKIRGKVVVVGVVSEGKVQSGDMLVIEAGGRRMQVTVESLEAFNKPLNSAKAGDRVGIMLHGVEREQVVLPALLAGTKEGA